jgi:hypothetical protein
MKRTLLEKIVLIGVIWGLAVLLLSAILEPTPENFTLGVSITLSGLYTLLLRKTRDHWLPWTANKPVRSAVLVGSLNAAIIETLFLVVEKIFGAEGVAAHPNLLLDLLLTMPWYIAMVWIFVRVQYNERFSPAAVLLLGALYELGADGIIGGVIIPGLMGTPVNLVEFLVLAALIAFWQFIPVYSSIVLPPAWILEAGLPAKPDHNPRWRQALLPLLALLPFLIYLTVFILIISQ